MAPKIVVSVVCDDDFEPGFVAMVGSLLRRNPWFDHEIRVISNAELCPLSDATRDRMQRRYANTTFHEAELGRYQRLLSQGRHLDRFAPVYIKLEAFSFTDADRVIGLDLDLLILGDISELFACTDPFNTVEAEHFDHGKRGLSHGAVFVVNHPHLTGELYDAMLATTISAESPTGEAADQAIMWEHFGHDSEHWSLDERFNTVRGLFPAGTGDLRENLQRLDSRIFHVGGAKPWFGQNLGGRWRQSEDLWFAEFDSVADDDDKARMRELQARHARA